MTALLPPLAAVLALLALAAEAAECGSGFAAPTNRIEGPRHRLLYQFEPRRIAVGQPFDLELQVCGKAGAGQPRAVKIDADMPAHRHGMNYLPEVIDRGDGRFAARGLLFHMPGVWRLTFEIPEAGGSQMLSVEHLVE